MFSLETERLLCSHRVMNNPVNKFGDKGYPDLHDHIGTLESKGLLCRIDAQINKDTELMPLVRWQFRGGISESERKAFIFTNVTDGKGRKFDSPVAVGVLAANKEIYSLGMGVPVEQIGSHWKRALANPLAPVHVETAPCQEVVVTGPDLLDEENGLTRLPVPVSTPGFDASPYLTATSCITVDPDTGIQNMGTYRGAIKSSNRIGLKLFVNLRQGGHDHWFKYRDRSQKMPIAMVIGSPPSVAYVSPQKIRSGVDEIGVAGALAGAPIRVVKAITTDLFVPADSEFVIEGLVDTRFLEPEGPFGESHGHINLEEYNFIIEVTAITRRRDAIMTSIISQVTPSESSVIKRVAMEPKFLNHLRDGLGIKGLLRVSMHEPLTNIRRIVFLVFERGVSSTEIWRAMYGVSAFDSAVGKYVIAINDDIDPENGDAILWALAYRSNPAVDSQVLPHRDRGHGPALERGNGEDASLLIDATLKANMPPIALPKREIMENAKILWERLGFPKLSPESPWYGYSLGDWTKEWDEMAHRASEGGYFENGLRSSQLKRSDVAPNTSIRDV
ncbi:MAG: UbiD family decarboxylase [Rhodospirillaceae bacterium]